MNWKRALSYLLITRDGRQIKTLHDARDYMIGLSGERQMRNEWQHAADLCLKAADGGDIEPQPSRCHLALLLGAQLDMKQTKS